MVEVYPENIAHVGDIKNGSGKFGSLQLSNLTDKFRYEHIKTFVSAKNGTVLSMVSFGFRKTCFCIIVSAAHISAPDLIFNSFSIYSFKLLR